MIATHSVKLVNSKIQNDAICSRILCKIPPNLICSSTITLSREFFVSPKNSAEYKKFKEILPAFKFKESLPKIGDTHVKQILLPTSRGFDDYICAMPAYSLGVINEWTIRNTGEGWQRMFKHIVQPSSIARSNHGEIITKQSGNMYLLSRTSSNVNSTIKYNISSDTLVIRCRCQDINMSSGMLSVGFPSVTAIGGFVHSLERKLKTNIDFLFGTKNSNIGKYIRVAKINGSKEPKAINRLKTIASVGTSFVTDEIMGSCDIIIILKTQDGSAFNKKICTTEINQKTRIAGGQIWDLTVQYEGIVENENYCFVKKFNEYDDSDLNDCPLDVARKYFNKIQEKEIGIQELEKIKEKLFDPKNINYGLMMIGYALLENPIFRKNTRSNYKSAWCEPVFSLIEKSQLSIDCFWRRRSIEGLIFWDNARNREMMEEDSKRD